MKCLAIVVFLGLASSSAAAQRCAFMPAERLDRILPQGAPWMLLGGADRADIPGLDVPGVEHCSYATDPHATYETFVDPQAPSVMITTIAMPSAEAAETKQKNALETYRRDAKYDVATLPAVAANAFRYEPVPTPGASAGIVSIQASRSNIVISQSLLMPRAISPRDRDAAAALMTAVLESLP